MKKKNYPLGYKVMLFLVFPYFMGSMAFAAVSPALEPETQELSDHVLRTLVQETQKSQEKKEAISAFLKENNVVGVVLEKDDGSSCQVSKQENPEDYIPSFMSTGDSLEDFGLPACGEEELAVIEHTAQVAAVEGGPSQAKTAAGAVFQAIAFTIGGAVGGGVGSCAFGGSIAVGTVGGTVGGGLSGFLIHDALLNNYYHGSYGSYEPTSGNIAIRGAIAGAVVGFVIGSMVCQ